MAKGRGKQKQKEQIEKNGEEGRKIEDLRVD